jgi:hypothetical protein
MEVKLAMWKYHVVALELGSYVKLVCTKFGGAKCTPEPDTPSNRPTAAVLVRGEYMRKWQRSGR